MQIRVIDASRRRWAFSLNETGYNGGYRVARCRNQNSQRSKAEFAGTGVCGVGDKTVCAISLQLLTGIRHCPKKMEKLVVSAAIINP